MLFLYGSIWDLFLSVLCVIKKLFFLTKPFLAVFIGILAFPHNVCIAIMTWVVASSVSVACHHHIASLPVALLHLQYVLKGRPPLLLFFRISLSFLWGSGCDIWEKILLIHFRFQKGLISRWDFNLRKSCLHQMLGNMLCRKRYGMRVEDPG